MRSIHSCLCAAALLALFPLLPTTAAEPAGGAAGKIDFNRDIRPILSDNCFACHGPDAKARKGDLRLDTKEGMLAKVDDSHIVLPGKPEASELYKRIITSEKDDLMPPAKSGKKLTAAQKELIRQWIEQGANWSQHWAFVTPRRPEPPAVKNKNWLANTIDQFILARLEKEGLQPSPQADKETLARRAAQDLTGLPPTPEEVDAFLADKSPQAYEKLVDRLMDSPRYGERMALDWLDAARYADTHGFHIDSQRDMWPWRDLLIEKFNKNQRFDQFTIEQLAGDLLPNATPEQQVASGFNRNHCINFEGGAFPQEYLTAYIIDRVNTTATTWLGLTMGCAQCHDHKYDPITQKEFFQLYAFFNRVPENGLDGRNGNAVPFVPAMSATQRQQLETLAAKVKEAQARLDAHVKTVETPAMAWAKQAAANVEGGGSPTVPADMIAHFPFDERKDATVTDAVGKKQGKIRGKPDWVDGKFGGALRFDGETFVHLGDVLDFERSDRFSYGAWVNVADTSHMAILSKMKDGEAHRGYDLYLGDGMVYVHLVHQFDGNAIRVNTKAKPINPGTWQHVFITYDGSSKAAGIRVYVDGKLYETVHNPDRLSGTTKLKTPAHIGARNPGAKFKGAIDDVRYYGRELSAAEVAALAGGDPIRPILAIAPDKWTAAQKKTLIDHYLRTQDAAWKKLNDELATVRSEESALQKNTPTSMVMSDAAMRDTFILLRGEYDKPGAKVTAGLPAALPPLPTGAPMNRLGLAKWLVDPAHPLTARVIVNRMWQMHFGTGLVKTSEDFGVQGEQPSHPELLDWLANEFIRSGWDVKQMHRLIVTSAAYKQSSKVTPELFARDPENRLLARGPRFRLQAELIRDHALYVSGLLVEKIGGPSVKPYQPPGLWEEVAYGGGVAGFTAGKFDQDKGEALYRKSMYTFWKRTSPPPALSTFDAPEREFCVVRRSRTNTPLQALVTMNDPTYVEASRKFAERMMEKGGDSVEQRVTFAIRWSLARQPKPAEIKVLSTAYEKALSRYRADKPAAEKLLSVGEAPRNAKLDTAELAAWTMVANVLLNLDETMTKN